MHPVVWLVSGRPIAIVIAIVWIRLEVGFILDSIGGRIYLGFHYGHDGQPDHKISVFFIDDFPKK